MVVIYTSLFALKQTGLSMSMLKCTIYTICCHKLNYHGAERDEKITKDSMERSSKVWYICVDNTLPSCIKDARISFHLHCWHRK